MPNCIHCGTELQKRNGQFGEFYFCPNVYTKECRGYTVAADKFKPAPPPTRHYYNERQENARNNKCSRHSAKHWVESVPVGAGYCRACVEEEYKAAPRCPYCGIKAGFAMGTGDCGCEPDYDVGF